MRTTDRDNSTPQAREWVFTDRNGKARRSTRFSFAAAPLFATVLSCSLGSLEANAINAWQGIGPGCGGLVRGSSTTTISDEDLRTLLTRIEQFWLSEFRRQQWPFEEIRVVHYTGIVLSPSGPIQREMGPVYSVKDKTIYVSQTVMADLADRLGPASHGLLIAILAHEIGHHIQNLRGSIERALAHGLLKFGSDIASLKNWQTVRMELQADCLAGLAFGHFVRMGYATYDQLADASARMFVMGDDIQILIRFIAKGQVAHGEPHYAHPKSGDRRRWFEHGANSHGIEACETFGIPVLN